MGRLVLDWVLQVAVTLVIAAGVELPIAVYNRRVILKEVAASEARVLAVIEQKLVAPPAGKMRGDVDPLALLDAKAAKAEERAVEAASNKAEALAMVAEKLGSAEAAGLFWRWLEEVEPEVAETVGKYRSGLRALKPFLARFQRVQPNGTEAARQEPAGFIFQT